MTQNIPKPPKTPKMEYNFQIFSYYLKKTRSAINDK